jgi:2,4-dienoyl-CoA reductase-like NADH-dependent reductase (Old Yellow Enzyme family)
MKLSGRDEHNAYTAPFVRTVGNTLADTIELSKWLADAGLDAIHVSEGDSFPHPLVPAGGLPADEVRHVYHALFYEGTRTALMLLLMQLRWFRRAMEWNWSRRVAYTRDGRLLPDRIEGMNQDDAAQIRRASGLPVICVGGWQTAGPIRQALTAGHCDVVSIARGLLANPTLVRMFEQGRDAPDRPCTYCNKCAVNALQYPLACWEEARFDSREQMFAEAYRLYEEAAVGAEPPAVA